MIGAVHILSQVLGGLAFALLLPAAVGLATGETAAAEAYLAVGGLVGFVAGAMFFALQGRRRRLDRVAGFLLVVLVWVVPPLIAAVPIARAAGVDYVTALFEAVSGYTTTGATAFETLRPLGFSGTFFRAELQWLGGLMTPITLATVLAPSGIGGMVSSNLALIASPDDPFGRLLGGVRRVLAAYGATTILCGLLLLASGIRPFDAVCLALATVSTGGFVPIDGSLADYDNPFAEVVIAVFMLVGATSILWHRMIVEGRWQLVRLHRESYFVIGVAVLAGLAYAAAFLRTGEGGAGTAILDGLFAGASLVSTTGFEPRPGGLGALPVTLVLLLALIGGGTISTAGGIKYYRVGGTLVQSLDEMRRLVYPHAVRRHRFGTVTYDLDLMKGLWSHLAAAFAVIAIAALLLALSLPDFEASLVAAVSAFSNIGPLYAAGWQPHWPAYPDFDALSKLVMAATMILGRIEVLALFAAFNLAYWRS